MSDANHKRTALSVNLPTAMVQAIFQQVRNGTYDSAGGLIREAVRQLLKLDEDGVAPPPEADERSSRKRSK